MIGSPRRCPGQNWMATEPAYRRVGGAGGNPVARAAVIVLPCVPQIRRREVTMGHNDNLETSF